MTWSTVRDGLKTRLDTISGLSARALAPDNLPDRDTATVVPGEPLIEPYAHRNKVQINAKIVVRSSRGKVMDSQSALDAYLWPSGAQSIIAAIYADPTLSGTVDDVQFVSITGYGGVENKAAAQAEINLRMLVTAGGDVPAWSGNTPLNYPQHIFKTADQTNATALFVNDTELVMHVVQGETYTFRASIYTIEADTFDFDWDKPAGLTMVWGITKQLGVGLGTNLAANVGGLTNGETSGLMYLEGMIYCASLVADSGEVAFKFREIIDGMTVKAGSKIELFKVTG